MSRALEFTKDICLADNSNRPCDTRIDLASNHPYHQKKEFERIPHSPIPGWALSARACFVPTGGVAQMVRATDS